MKRESGGRDELCIVTGIDLAMQRPNQHYYYMRDRSILEVSILNRY